MRQYGVEFCIVALLGFGNPGFSMVHVHAYIFIITQITTKMKIYLNYKYRLKSLLKLFLILLALKVEAQQTSSKQFMELQEKTGQ